MRPAVCLNSGLDLANFRDHLRVTECQKPFEELAAILWIHKRSGGSFRKFQKQLFLAQSCGEGHGRVAMYDCKEYRRVYCVWRGRGGRENGKSYSAALELPCLTLLGESLGFCNLCRSHAACSILSIV